MTLQNGEFGDSRVNPLQPGVSDAAARVPDGGSFEKGPGDGAGKKRKNPRHPSVSDLSVRKLKRLHGESQGRDQAVEEELRARGFNSQMLEEVQWEWGQQQWERSLRQSGYAAAPGSQGKEDELAKWRRLPSGTHSTAEVQKPPRKTKRQRQLERLLKRRQEREAGLRPPKRRR